MNVVTVIIFSTCSAGAAGACPELAAESREESNRENPGAPPERLVLYVERSGQSLSLGVPCWVIVLGFPLVLESKPREVLWNPRPPARL